MELLSPKNDVVFQKLFGKNENKEILISFLNAVLRKTLKEKIIDVKIEEKKIDISMVIDEKVSILDIYVTTDKNEHINVEMQIANEYNMVKRTLYYWSKMFLNQLTVGEDFVLLNKTITINLIDFNLIKNDKMHNVYHLKENETNEELTDLVEINFIEMKKLKKEIQKENKDEKLGMWLNLIMNPNSEEVEKMAQIDEDLRKAREVLALISCDKETRQLAEMREKAILDKISFENGARRAGYEEGMNDGMRNGELKKAKSIALNLLDVLDDKVISEKTGLSIEEVKELRKQQ